MMDGLKVRMEKTKRTMLRERHSPNPERRHPNGSYFGPIHPLCSFHLESFAITP